MKERRRRTSSFPKSIKELGSCRRNSGVEQRDDEDDLFIFYDESNRKKSLDYFLLFIRYIRWICLKEDQIKSNDCIEFLLPVEQLNDLILPEKRKQQRVFSLELNNNLHLLVDRFFVLEHH